MVHPTFSTLKKKTGFLNGISRVYPRTGVTPQMWLSFAACGTIQHSGPDVAVVYVWGTKDSGLDAMLYGPWRPYRMHDCILPALIQSVAFPHTVYLP